MTRAGPALGLAAWLAVGSWVSGARADEVSGLLDQGVALRRDHRNEEALVVFAQAARLSSEPRVRAQLGLAEQAVGHWLDAERELTDALAASDDPWIAKNREALVGARDVVLQHLSWISVDCDAQDAEMLLDGQPIARGAEVRVASGSGVLEVRGPGRVPDIRRVMLLPTEHAHVSVTLVPLLAAPTAGPAPAPAQPLATAAPPGEAPRSTTVSVLPWVLGASALAALGAGTYFGIHTLQDKSNRDANCVRGCNTTAIAYDSDARTSATIATVSFGVGAALLAVEGALWWLDRTPRAPDHARVRVVPAVAAGMGGLVVRGEL